jgi:hypothetical protein
MRSTNSARRHAKSFQQRLVEKTTRAKRLAVAKEAHHWYMKDNASKLREPNKSSASYLTAITPEKRNKMSSSAKSFNSPPTFTPPSKTKTTMAQTLRRTFPYNCDYDRMEANLKLAGFTTPKRKEDDCDLEKRMIGWLRWLDELRWLACTWQSRVNKMRSYWLRIFETAI